MPFRLIEPKKDNRRNHLVTAAAAIAVAGVPWVVSGPPYAT